MMILMSTVTIFFKKLLCYWLGYLDFIEKVKHGIICNDSAALIYKLNFTQK